MDSLPPTEKPPRPEPRWPAMLGVITTASVLFSLPETLTPGPHWAAPGTLLFLLIPSTILHRAGQSRWAHLFGILISGVGTSALIWSLSALIRGLPDHSISAPVLLRASATLWLGNILVFASWYWRLDGGGPHLRDRKQRHLDGAFLFPQMSMEGSAPWLKTWRPGFVDYLALAFTTSTAFSPADVVPLSRWAKMLMMAQSLISLITLAIVAARAVNMM